jgi:hypothetical protein
VAYLLVLATLFQVIAMASWQKGSEVITDARVSFYDRISLSVQLATFGVVVILVMRIAGVI